MNRQLGGWSVGALGLLAACSLPSGDLTLAPRESLRAALELCLASPSPREDALRSLLLASVQDTSVVLREEGWLVLTEIGAPWAQSIAERAARTDPAPGPRGLAGAFLKRGGQVGLSEEWMGALDDASLRADISTGLPEAQLRAAAELVRRGDGEASRVLAREIMVDANGGRRTAFSAWAKVSPENALNAVSTALDSTLAGLGRVSSRAFADWDSSLTSPVRDSQAARDSARGEWIEQARALYELIGTSPPESAREIMALRASPPEELAISHAWVRLAIGLAADTALVRRVSLDPDPHKSGPVIRAASHATESWGRGVLDSAFRVAAAERDFQRILNLAGQLMAVPASGEGASGS